jgi:hypothetical protein
VLLIQLSTLWEPVEPIPEFMQNVCPFWFWNAYWCFQVCTTKLFKRHCGLHIIQFMTKHTLVLMQPKEPTNIISILLRMLQRNTVGISINHWILFNEWSGQILFKHTDFQCFSK